MCTISLVTLILIFALCESAHAASRRAILIGINNYNSGDSLATTTPSVPRKNLKEGDVRYWQYPDLNGPIADVALMEGLLKSPDFGFADGDIVKLTNEAATAQAILATLQSELVDHATSGDIRFVYYSGHGNYIRNTASKERDQLDQTIVPADNRLGVVDVRDKELSRILWAAAKKGVVVTFIADSCHSGSLTRGPENGRVVRSNHGVRSSGLGADFKEPVIEDAATIDPQTKQSIDPEDLGILTLAGAQRNQESIEQKFTDDPSKEVHGALTFALVRALQTEGPHSSMNVIFDRILNFLYAENLSQTPVLGGKGRGEKDILGQPVMPSSFSVSVKGIRGKDIILRGGQAIGIYPGCELSSASSGPGSPTLTLRVTDSQSLSESTAQIEKGTHSVAIGDRFVVTSWAVPPESVLRVYIPPPADTSNVMSTAQSLAELATDNSINWVLDPTEENPTDIIRWNGKSWILEHLGATVSTIDLGLSPKAADVRGRLSSQSKLFVFLPPTPQLISAIDLGSGKHNAIEKITNGTFSDAQYGLFGRLHGAAIEYGWVETDGELYGSKPQVGGMPPHTDETNSSLPVRTDWYGVPDMTIEQVGSSLTDSASRLGNIRAWLKLQGRPGQTVFPYDLVFRKVGSSQTNVTGGKLKEGDRYKLYLTERPDYKKTSVKRRWIYVFDIDSSGKGTLILPELGSGNEGNHLPLSRVEEDATAPSLKLIPLFSDTQYDFEVSPPFGTDTFILLTSDQSIEHPQIFQFPGVKFRSAGYPNDLENLLSDVGSSERGVTPNKSPGQWSVQRLIFTSIKK